MTKLSTAPAATRESQPQTIPTALAAVPATPVLITEQQVLFATAAAAPVAPGRAHRLTLWLHAMFVPVPRSRPPARLDFLERSAMSREMRRL